MLTFSWVRWNPELLLKQTTTPHIGGDGGLTRKQLWSSPSRASITYSHATAEFSTDKITFLDLCLYNGDRFEKEGILDIKPHIKPTSTQQYVHASSAHPPGTGHGTIKRELLSNEATFQYTYHSRPVARE